ncbi:hypothetical protein GCK72_013321 [Caenorhabditis remanei]|uniref:Uncharacterized protein n=1 Tax=Caenorhabditis remanei TaxID=31234 RepID=A0A6A5GNS0_CAERE|nr:hypothetical protein GCK72_013321 [Caenorhabditis remanei]KAF1756867.1 hypothetical protein GCK72_013321 [Caenorhabditis remanei]
MRESTILTILLILNSLCAVLSTNYHFTFHVKLHCGIPYRKVGYNAQFFDKDYMWFNSDDPITEQYKTVAPPGDIAFKAEGTLTGDEWLTDFFEVKMVLFHTCTPSGKAMAVDLVLYPWAYNHYNLEDDKYYRYEFTRNITELSGDLVQPARLDKT